MLEKRQCTMILFQINDNDRTTRIGNQSSCFLSNRISIDTYIQNLKIGLFYTTGISVHRFLIRIQQIHFHKEIITFFANRHFCCLFSIHNIRYLIDVDKNNFLAQLFFHSFIKSLLNMEQSNCLCSIRNLHMDLLRTALYIDAWNSQKHSFYAKT